MMHCGRKLIFLSFKVERCFCTREEVGNDFASVSKLHQRFQLTTITLALVCNQLRLDTFSIFLEALSVSCILDLIMCILNHQSDDLTCFTHYLSLAIFVAIYTLLGRDDICHKYYKQRLCKIITTWV